MPLVFAVVLIAGILIGVRMNRTSQVTGSRGLMYYSPINKTSQVLELITDSYVDTISTAQLEDAAIKAMLQMLDPHSRYIPASQIAAENEPIEGNFSGIGVSFNMMNDTIVVVNTTSKGPSEKSGIMAGDRIVKVNDSLVAGVKMASDDIVKMLRGKAGTKVHVDIFRKGIADLMKFEITRGSVPLYSVDAAYMITPEIGYIKVNKFSKTTLAEFTEALKELSGKGMKQLMIDLRDNGGGIIDAAVGLSELFLPKGKLIVYTEGHARPRTDYLSNGKTSEYQNMDLVLLINELSASASEIVAGAIQDNDRGNIIGRRSFGKGLVQEQHSLYDGSAVRLTISRYYTPTGRCIQKPYDHGDNEYYNELNARVIHGEMEQADSIRFNDSLKFVTPGGKIVYGGGGIMPDIFIPQDTSDYSKYYAQIIRKGLIYRFAFNYADKHRSTLVSKGSYDDLANYLHRENILNQFVAYAKEQGVQANSKDLHMSGDAIENTVTAYITRNIFDDKGFYPILNRRDQDIKIGIETLEQQSK